MAASIILASSSNPSAFSISAKASSHDAKAVAVSGEAVLRFKNYSLQGATLIHSMCETFLMLRLRRFLPIAVRRAPHRTLDDPVAPRVPPLFAKGKYGMPNVQHYI